MNWEADVLELTYEDTMSVYRKEKNIDSASGITKLTDKLIVSDVKCSLSRSSKALHSDEPNNLVSNDVIFCRPEIDVIEGDTLKVNKLGKIFIVEAGRPFPYISHLEIPVISKGRI